MSHCLQREGEDFGIDWKRLVRVTETMTRMLEDIIEMNVFPDPLITEATLRTRKIGLGIMGWADMLAMLQIPYDSIEAVALAREVMRSVQQTGHRTSEALAEEREPFPAFEDIVDSVGSERRNATVTCIAPTGSISLIAGASSGIEPHYKLDYTRYLGSERTPVLIQEPIVPRLDDEGIDFIPKTALEIHWKWHIEHQAAFQKFVDLAVSKTVNLPEDTDWKTILAIYREAWLKGCKGVTVYRNKSRRAQVLSG